jgi:thymidylate synthase (FAD)
MKTRTTEPIQVLDKGSVELLMSADSDLTVVNCARVSFGKESEWEKVVDSQWNAQDVNGDEWLHTTHKHVLSDRDQKLIHYLARNNHWSPFAHPQIRLQVKAPIFVRTQLFKHKTGAVENEVSRRYVDDPPEFYEPEVWRGRPEGGIKQGSSECRTFGIEDCDRIPVAQCEDLYNGLIQEGVAPEQARMVLPQSTYTEWIWTGSLAFFARVFRQRSDPHAQWETQQYAAAISEIIAPLFPVSWEALTGVGNE